MHQQRLLPTKAVVATCAASACAVPAVKQPVAGPESRIEELALALPLALPLPITGLWLRLSCPGESVLLPCAKGGRACEAAEQGEALGEA